MRTEQTLHDAFALLDRAADRAHPSEAPAVLPAGAQLLIAPTPRRRWAVPATAAASVALIAATAAGAVWLANSGDDATAGRTQAGAQSNAASTSSPVARSAAPSRGAPSRPVTPPHEVVALQSMPRRELAFTVTAPGLTAAGALFDTTEQTLDLVGPSGSYVVRVYTDKAGPAYDPAGAVPVSVGGRRGYFAQLTSDTDGSQRGVAWEYAPGGWASVARIDAPITRAQGVALARTVQVGEPSVARTPVAFSSVAGLHTSLWLTGYGNDPHRAGQHGYSQWNALYDVTFHGAQVTVTADDIPGGLVTSGDALSVNGHAAHVLYTSDDHIVSIGWNGHTVDVQENVDGSTGRFSLSRARLLELARAVSLVDDPADPATWHDARSALPA